VRGQSTGDRLRGSGKVVVETAHALGPSPTYAATTVQALKPATIKALQTQMRAFLFGDGDLEKPQGYVPPSDG